MSNADPAALDSLTEIVAAFQSADGNLNNTITALSSTASSGLSSETSRAQSVESSLNNALSAEISNRVVDVDNEESRAISAEGSLTTRVSIETSRATSAEVSLTTRVSSEEVARASADTSLASRVSAEESRSTSLTTRVSSEEVTRASADTSLTSRVSAEESRAQSVETSLSSRISSEISRGTSVEVSLNAEIVALPSTDGLTLEVNTSDNTVRLKQTVAPAKDGSGATTFRVLQGDIRFSGGTTTFSGATTHSGVLAKMSVQPNTLAGFDDLTLITKGYFDSIYGRKNTTSGLVNGSNAVFTLTNPVKSGSEQIYLNGLLQSVTNDYTLGTNASGFVTGFTFTVAPNSGSTIITYGVY
jgi:hypothetical protein